MRSNLTQNDSRNREPRGVRAGAGFTLIELLVVIAIIGLLAGMVLHVAPLVNSRRKSSIIEAEKAWLGNAIEAYKLKMGSYPPDNPATINCAAGSDAYFDCTATNTLLYELTGAKVVDPTANTVLYEVYYGTNIASSDFHSLLGLDGIINAAPANSSEQRSVAFLNPAPKAPQHKYYRPLPLDNAGNPPSLIRGLIVPVTLDALPLVDATRHNPADYVNFWHYDCSSTNRHNRDSFDIWAAYTVGANIVTNGNWIQP